MIITWSTLHSVLVLWSSDRDSIPSCSAEHFFFKYCVVINKFQFKSIQGEKALSSTYSQSNNGLLPARKTISGEALVGFNLNDPFERRGKLVRSPSANLNVKRISDQRSSSGGANFENEADAFTHLGSLIQNPVEYASQRNNLYHAIKAQVRSINAT